MVCQQRRYFFRENSVINVATAQNIVYFWHKISNQMKHFYLFIFCFWGLTAFAQVQQDSIWAVWEDTKRADTVRLEALHFVAYNIYSFSQPDSAILLSKVEYDFAKEKKQPKYMAKALMTQGLVNKQRGDYANALSLMNQALTINEQNKINFGIAASLNNIGMIYQEQKDFAKAKEYFGKSLIISRQLNSTRLLASLYNNLGIISKEERNYVKAIEYYQESMKIYQAATDKKGEAMSMHNIAGVYLSKYNYYNNKRKMIEQKKKEGKWERADSSLLNKDSLAIQLPLAISLYEKSLVIRKEINDKTGILNTLTGLGGTYFELGDDNKAMLYGKEAYSLAQELQSALDMRNTANLLYLIHKKQGNSAAALKMFEVYAEMNDSILGEESRTKVLRQESRYEYDKKSLADSLQYAQNQQLAEVKLSRQRTLTFGGFAALALVCLLLFFVFRQSKKTEAAKQRSDELLLNILPEETAEELKATGTAQPKRFEQVTILFTDFKNFSQIAEKLAADELVHLINECFSGFDRIISAYNIEKIKTIGDSYMCAAGLPVESETHALDMVQAALELQQFVEDYKKVCMAKNLPIFEVRIGIHTGNVVAGVVGIKKFAYDIWGDTVNTASRMESSGEAGKVNISHSTYLLVKEHFVCEYRGKITAKNKGEIDMYFVKGKG